MMSRKGKGGRLLGAVFLAIAACGSSLAADGTDVIQRIKAATAYLEIPGTRGSGSAICVAPEGVFYTCAHVLGDLKIGDPVKLVLDAGTPAERPVDGRIERIERGQDLAAIKADLKDAAFLTLGDASTLKETDPVIAAGYPFGRALAVGGASPAVTVTTGKVTALRRDGGRVDTIQIDAELNPGNSGGPVVDAKGRVVGMASARIDATGINFALGSYWLKALAETPLMRLQLPPRITAEMRNRPLEIPVELVFLKPPSAKPELSAAFEGGPGDVRPLEVTPREPGKYLVSGVPVPPGGLAAGRLLRLECVIDQGAVRHTTTLEVADAGVEVGGKTMRLSEISALVPGTGRVIRNDGAVADGAIRGLDRLIQQVESEERPFDASGYQLVLVRPDTVAMEQVVCVMVVRNGDYSKTVRIPFEVDGAEARSAAGDPTIPRFDYDLPTGPGFEGESRDLDPGGQIHDAAWGGGGRYLVVQLLNSGKLVILDTVEGRITGEVPAAEASVVFAAGGHELFVARGDQVERWSLADGKKLAEPAKWLVGEITALGCGATWTRQLAVASSVFSGHSNSRLEIRDSRTGEIHAIEPRMAGLSQVSSLRAAAMAPLVIAGNDDSSRVHCLRFGSGGLEVLPEHHQELGSCDASGAWRMGPRGLFAPVNRSSWVGGDKEQGALVPTTVPGLALRLRMPGRNSSDRPQPPLLDLVDLDSSEVVLRGALVLDELAPTGNSRAGKREKLTPDKRCLVVPQLQRLITIGNNHRTVRLRKFDAWAAMKREGRSFLHVSSVVPDLIPAGIPFKMALETGRSGKGRPRFEVLSAPPGLAVDPEGVLDWPSPQPGDGGRLVLRITGSDGAEALWQREIHAR
jgi:S1-C subfamily serine protease